MRQVLCSTKSQAYANIWKTGKHVLFAKLIKLFSLYDQRHSVRWIWEAAENRLACILSSLVIRLLLESVLHYSMYTTQNYSVLKSNVQQEKLRNEIFSKERFECFLSKGKLHDSCELQRLGLCRVFFFSTLQLRYNKEIQWILLWTGTPWVITYILQFIFIFASGAVPPSFGHISLKTTGSLSNAFLLLVNINNTFDICEQ